ncbi:hypothetical protein [Microbispora triticiradicis]|uniref:hypothetical protein n=1 Tax=Microbispora triticiradicis TaxID=2200763 RepID=UPI00140521FD|nr:hypothetical protein [Microbispora triticiradicis]
MQISAASGAGINANACAVSRNDATSIQDDRPRAAGTTTGVGIRRSPGVIRSNAIRSSAIKFTVAGSAIPGRAAGVFVVSARTGRPAAGRVVFGVIAFIRTMKVARIKAEQAHGTSSSSYSKSCMNSPMPPAVENSLDH